MEFKIHVSSESSRSSDPYNSPGNFKTVFDKPITLDQNKSYLIDLGKTETMTYSWYNISEQYKNNKTRYGVLSDEKDESKTVNNPYAIAYNPIEFSPGSYSYDNVNEYIKDVLTINNHPSETTKLEFDLSKFKCMLIVKSGFILDLR